MPTKQKRKISTSACGEVQVDGCLITVKGELAEDLKAIARRTGETPAKVIQKAARAGMKLLERSSPITAATVKGGAR